MACYVRPKLTFSFSLSPSSVSLSSSFTTGFLSGRNSVAMVISISFIGMAQCGRPAGGGGGGGVILTFLNIRRGRLCWCFHPPSVNPLCVVDHVLKVNLYRARFINLFVFSLVSKSFFIIFCLAALTLP